MRRGTPRDKPVAPADQRRFERMRVRKQFGKDFLSEIKQCVQKTDFLIKQKASRPKPPPKKVEKAPTTDDDDNYPHVKFVITPRSRPAYARGYSVNRPQKTMAPKIEDAEYERRGFGKPTMKDRSDSEKEVLERFDLAQRREAEDELRGQSDDYSSGPSNDSVPPPQPKPAPTWRDTSSEQFSEMNPRPKIEDETSEQEWNWKKIDQIEVSESEEEDAPSPQKPLSGPTASDRQKQISEPRRDSAIKRISNGGEGISPTKSLPAVETYEKEEAEFHSQPRPTVQKFIEPELDLSDDENVQQPVEEEEEWEAQNPEEDAYSVADEEEDAEKRGSRNQFMASTDEDDVENVEEETPTTPQGIAEYMNALAKSRSDDALTPSSDKQSGFKFPSSDGDNEPGPQTDDPNVDMPLSVDGVVEHSFQFSSTEEQPQHIAPPEQPEAEEEESDSNWNQFLDLGTDDDGSSEAYEVNAYTDTREEEIRENRKKDRLIYSTDTA